MLFLALAVLQRMNSVFSNEDSDAQVIARAQAEARAVSMPALSDSSVLCEGVPFAGQTAQKTLAIACRCAVLGMYISC